MEKPNLSIILTAHSEGLLAHKTLRNIFSAVKLLEKKNVSYEIIVHIDNGTKETLNYFSRYEKDPRFKIFKNNFKDPGLSRNFAVKNSSGEVISLIDADDLFSDNWLLLSYEFIKSGTEPVIVHPEASLTFGNSAPHVLWLQHNSENSPEDLLIACGANRWISMCSAPREVFLETPYPKTRNGYGNEDWWFNTETEAKGIAHKILPSTIQFYRQKPVSVLSKNNNEKSVQEYTSLFSLENCQKLFKDSSAEKEALKPSLKTRLYKSYKKIRNSRLNAFITPVARPVRIAVDKIENLSRPRVEKKAYIPDFVLLEWRKITKIEPQLYPTKSALENVVRYYSDSENVVGAAFIKSLKNVPALPDYVFIVPWLVAGGADKVVLNYIKAFLELNPSLKIAVLTTLPAKNTWEKELPENAFLIDFGNNSIALNEDQKSILFARLLAQLKTKNLHLVNSEYGYRWIAAHKTLIKNEFNLNVSVFCYDFIPETNNEAVFDYLDPYLFSIHDVIKNIFTDNKAVISRAVETCGLSKEKFKVHYQPILDDLYPPKDEVHHPLKILWASRIAYQKCPETLVEIAKRLNPDDYRIEVFGRLDNGYNKSIFDNIPSLVYRGSYNGFSSLETSDYDVYLYTSNIDGVPNCLLEATAAGLPLIAPNVGGISELVKDKKTGILIDDFSDIDAYVSALNFIKKNPRALSGFVLNAQSLLKSQHSWQKFVKIVKSDLNLD